MSNVGLTVTRCENGWMCDIDDYPYEARRRMFVALDSADVLTIVGQVLHEAMRDAEPGRPLVPAP